MICFLQITTTSGNQWKLLLETKTQVSFSTDTEVTDMGYDNLDCRTIPPRSILDISGKMFILISFKIIA